MHRYWDLDEHSVFACHLVNENNIFKPDTLEGILVDSVIEVFKVCRNALNPTFVQPYSSFANHDIHDALSHVILRNLRGKGMDIKLDYYGASYLPNKAIWHARMSGCVEVFPERTHANNAMNTLFKKKVLFGVFLEGGLNDLFRHTPSVTTLQESAPDTEKAMVLLKIAKAFSQFKTLKNIPAMCIGNNQVVFKNIFGSHYANKFYRNNDLPLQTWNWVGQEEVCANTRGSFHHLGDEFAFILSALKFGDCCIFCHDEFGELLVLCHLSSDYSGLQWPNSLDGKVLSVQDFDYIYGVPRSHALYPTAKNNVFTYADEGRDHCISVSKESSYLSNEYWKNQVFLSFAGRKIQETTIPQLGADLKKVIEGQINPTLLEEILNPKFLSSSFQYDYLSFKKEIDRNVATLAKPYGLNIKQINTNIEKEFSFFIKTISHKVACSIFNPQADTGTGFFKKLIANVDAPGTSPEPAINLSFVLYALCCYVNRVNKKELVPLYNQLNIPCIDFKSNNNHETSYLAIWKHFDFWEKIIAYKISGEHITSFFGKKFDHLFEHWQGQKENTLVQSALVPMQYEYRIFVINHRPTATSACFRNTTPFNAWSGGVFDPRLCDGHNAQDTFETSETRKIVAQYAKFSRKFTKAMQKDYPQYANYVLDVCYSKVKGKKTTFTVLPVEINSINFSGAYQIDFRRVCAAIAKKPIHKHYINSLQLDFANILEKGFSDLYNQVDPLDDNSIGIGG